MSRLQSAARHWLVAVTPQPLSRLALQHLAVWPRPLLVCPPGSPGLLCCCCCCCLLRTLTVLSQPLLTMRFTPPAGAAADTSDPGGTAGAQDTAVTPMLCALGICRETAGVPT